MDRYKVNQSQDVTGFVTTQSYAYLLKKFKELKKEKGHIVHVMGAPGAGKSTNIYQSAQELNLNMYVVKLELPGIEIQSRNVFELMVESIREDLKINSSKSVFSYLEKYDVILFADPFHDSHIIKKGTVGFSQWAGYNGIKSLNFYLICIYQYFKHRNDFKNINMVFQTAWRVGQGDNKKDLFTDMGFLSFFLVKLMGLIFEVVQISYSEEETIKIVKSHLGDVDSLKIKNYIKKYGMKPRFICQGIQDDLGNKPTG